MNNLHRTSLYSLHRELNAKTIPFAGYEMPVNYPLGILNEHVHCRKSAGLFDVSHMGQIKISSKSISMHELAGELEKLIPIDLISLSKDRQRYGFLTNESGGVIDDLMISNRGDHFFVVVNASRKEVDTNYFREKLISEVDILVETQRSLVALQGPLAERALSSIIQGIESMNFMDVRNMLFNNEEIYISRSGYTGQDGFEISLSDNVAEIFCRNLLNIKEVEAIGLGARDTLRLECGLCLYGQDLDEEISPVEAGLSWAIQKVRRTNGERAGGFPGAEIILDQIDKHPNRKRIGLLPVGKAPIRHGTKLFKDETGSQEIGIVTSGGYSPTTEKPISMGYLEGSSIEEDKLVYGEVRDKLLPLKIIKLPFVNTSFKK
ncbi:MAG: glycine cleavage system aminomethyltransferase GcvT [Pseudomonadota bacterium]|nr:glycine cleavage system aminomethyltransferase GcvT [Pseudomonadota bacterium]